MTDEENDQESGRESGRESDGGEFAAIDGDDASDPDVAAESDEPGNPAAPDAPDDADDADDRDEPDSPTQQDSSVRTKNRLLVVLGVTAVAFAVLFAVTFIDRSRLQDDLGRNEEIAQVAGDFGVALYTYDYQDIDGQIERMQALSTPSFAVEFQESYERTLRGQIQEREIVSTAELTDVLVSRSDGDQARAMVIAVTSLTRTNGASATISALVDLSLLRVDGKWLVDKVLTIANDGTMTDAEGNPIDPGELVGQGDQGDGGDPDGGDPDGDDPSDSAPGPDTPDTEDPDSEGPDSEGP